MQGSFLRLDSNWGVQGKKPLSQHDFYRQCDDLWHLYHMFTKEPPSLDFLQARFVHSSMENNIKSYFMEIARSNSYQLLIWWKRAPKNLSSFYFHNSWIYVEIMTQNVNFTIWSMQCIACQTSQKMYTKTLTVNKGHMVYINKLFPSLLVHHFMWQSLLFHLLDFTASTIWDESVQASNILWRQREGFQQYFPERLGPWLWLLCVS